MRRRNRLSGALDEVLGVEDGSTHYAPDMVLTSSTQRLDLGTLAPDFALTDTNGKTVKRADFAGTPLLVAFICNHCPFVKHIRAGLAQFGRDYGSKGLAIVAISSNDVATHPADGPEMMIEEARDAGYTFPYLFDETQDVAKAYGAACTPDFFLFDSAHMLIYRGRFDASRPEQPTPVTGADLRAAADAVLGKKTVAAAQHGSLGCNIKWKSGNEPVWFAPAVKR